MNNQDLISVIIPAYNHENYIVETIRSLIAQSYNNVELIIVNDGSTDNTAQAIQDIIPECEKRFTRFHYINKENEGVIKTINKGLSLVSGQYVYFVSSDDSAEPEALETLHVFLSKNNDYGLVVGDDYIMDDDGTRCYWNEKFENVYNKSEAKYSTFAEKLQISRRDVDFYSDEFGSYISLLSGNYIPNGFIIRKEILDEIGGYSETAPLEDYYMMMQISKISKMKFVDIPLYNYRWHSSNTVKQTKKLIKNTIETQLLEKNYAMANGYERDFLMAIGHKERLGIPFVLDITKKGGALKERDILRVLGIGIISITKTLEMKTIKFLGITVYKKRYEKV